MVLELDSIGYLGSGSIGCLGSIGFGQVGSIGYLGSIVVLGSSFAGVGSIVVEQLGWGWLLRLGWHSWESLDKLGD